MVVLADRCNLPVVTRLGPTPADLALLDEVAALGQQVGWPQLQRWRKAGLVASPRRPGAGRGKGRPSRSYPPGTAQVVAKVVEVVAGGYSLQAAALALFLSDLPVREDVLRRALLAALDIAPEILTEPDPDRRGDLVGELVPAVKRRARKHPLMRFWSQRSHGEVIMGPEWDRRQARPPEVMDNFLYALLSPVLAGEPYLDGREPLAHILGLTTPEPRDMEERLQTLSVENLQEAARRIPIARLRQGVVALRAIFAEGSESSAQKPNYQAAALIALALSVAADHTPESRRQP